MVLQSIQSFLPPASTRDSFTSVGINWTIYNNFLSPAKHIIQDQGSLKSSDIDRFAQPLQPGNHNGYSSTIRSVIRVMAVLGVFTLLSPMGVLWHAGHTAYYAVTLIKSRENMPSFEAHRKSLLWDLKYASVMALPALATASLLTKRLIHPFNLITNETLANVIKAVIIWFSVRSIRHCVDAISNIKNNCLHRFHPDEALHEALMLRSVLGLAATSGRPLTIAPEEKTQAQLVNNMYSLSGYFWDEYAINGLIMLQNFQAYIKAAQLKLSDEEKSFFANNPQEFLPHLKRLKLSQFQQELDEIQSSFDKYVLWETFLSKLLPHITLPKFAWIPETCSPYFSPSEPTLTNEAFHSRLNEIKALPSNTGPTPAFINLKQQIQRAQNPHQVLGLNENASLEECKKAWWKALVIAAPDKNPPDWKIESEILFKFIDLSFKSLTPQAAPTSTIDDPD